jgi:hypothetical protein
VTFRDRAESYALSGREAFHIVEIHFNGIVAALRRDQRFADISGRELELLLADMRADAELRLFNELRDRVHLDDVEYAEGGGLYVNRDGL